MTQTTCYNIYCVMRRVRVYTSVCHLTRYYRISHTPYN